MDVFYAAPPVARTLTAAAVITSLSGYSGLISLYRLIFVRQKVVGSFPPEIWRLVFSFLVTGPGFGILMDPYMLYMYSSDLERLAPRFSKKSDLFWFLCFNAAVILLLGGGVLGAHVFLPSLLMALSFTFAQEFPRRKVYFMIVPIEARFQPYALLLMTFVMAGPTATIVQSTGLISAHLYEFLTQIWPRYGGGRNWIETPQRVRQLFKDDRRNTSARGYGVAYNPSTRNTSSTTTSWTSGFRSTWSSHGQGRRLGDS